MATRVSDKARKMRKQPRQARSRDTVAVIVEAGAQVLARKGCSGFSTNEVAAAAGVSIGSIYQYFPNKVSLIDAIRFKHFQDVLRAFDLPEGGCDELEIGVGKLIDGMIESHELHPGLHRILLDEVPRPNDELADDKHFDLAYREGFSKFVAQMTGLAAPSLLELAASVLASAVEGMIHEAARRDGTGQREFRDEVVRLVVVYLKDRKVSG